MAQVRQAIVDEGLEVKVSSSAREEDGLRSSLSVPATSWMDDLAVPVRAAAPDDLLHNAGRTLQVIEAAISKIGVALNFGAGKSEILPILCGPGSRRAREDLLGRSGGTFAVQLREGVVSVTLTRSYVHLGSVIDTTASDLPDIRRRAILARELSISLKRLLHNPHLSLAEKSNFLASMPLARLRHGAGFWTLDTAKESHAFRSAYMEILRRAFRQVTGITSKGRSDYEVCCGLQLLQPEEARAVDVIRHAGWLLQDRSEVIQEFWLCQGAWRDECLRALSLLEPILRSSAASLWQQLQREPSLAKLWSRRLTKVCRRRNTEVGALLLPQWRAQQEAGKAGWIFCRLPEASEDLVGEHVCRTCHKAFRTAAALASRASRVHGRTAEATLATCGTRCEVCSTEFWSTGRLHQHMRQSLLCRQVTLQADLEPVPVRSEIGGAWIPAMKVQGPCPWWATLRPQASDTQQALTPVSGWDSILSLLSSKSSGEPAFLASSFVELATKFHLFADDRPLASFGHLYSDLLSATLIAVELKRKGFSGSFQSRLWKGNL